jgi:hypothetical protein
VRGKKEKGPITIHKRFCKKRKEKVLYFSTEKPTVKAHKHNFAKKEKKK